MDGRGPAAYGSDSSNPVDSPADRNQRTLRVSPHARVSDLPVGLRRYDWNPNSLPWAPFCLDPSYRATLICCSATLTWTMGVSSRRTVASVCSARSNWRLARSHRFW